MKNLAALLLAMGLLALSGCSYLSQGVVVPEDRAAEPAIHDIFGDSAEHIIYPQQNWGAAASLWFYNTTQGSNLLPYDLFLHLEQHDKEALFRSADNMRRFRYLVQRPSWDNPDGLPVGWVKDRHQKQSYIGLSCAACHTAQVNYRGTGIRIDGGPTLADMEQMLKALQLALTAAVEDPARFERLAQRLLGDNYAAEKENFRSQLLAVEQQMRNYNRINAPLHGDRDAGYTEVSYGYGRLDAFGRIYNRVLAHLTPGRDNFNPANAPVSYPFLWDTQQHDFVQWNGVADNALAGPLGRNTGEALGVFASINLQHQSRDLGYRSSVVVRNLNRIERQLGSLWSPSWAQLADAGVLPPINTELADQGRQVYAEYQCHSCHALIDRTDPRRRVIAQQASLDSIGTDPFMANNALNYTGLSGFLEGTPIDRLKPRGARFANKTSVLPALEEATTGVILEPDHDKWFARRWAEKIYDLIASIFDNPIQRTRKNVDFVVAPKDSPDSLRAYKARPLNGIWATAPFLHNGSVPNLYELFLPSCSDTEIAEGKACRSNEFTVGSLELDTVKVGFVQRDPAEHPGVFLFDTRLPSNSNKGHEYASGVTPVFKLDGRGRPVRDADGKPVMEHLPPMNYQQRMALVEYLKSL